jgi:hypothetical protein
MINNQERDSDIYKLIQDKIFAEFYCHRIGIIKSFNPVKQTANITLVDLPFKGEKTFEEIFLCDVPLQTNATQDAGQTFPIKVGDVCVVSFDDRNKDDYFKTGNTRKPANTRKHHINDCYFSILSPKPETQTLDEYVVNAVKTWYKNTYLQLEENKLTLKTALVGLTIDGSKIDLKNTTSGLAIEETKATLKTALAKVEVDDNLIAIKNNLYGQKEILTAILTIMKSGIFIGNPLIETVQVQVNGLYK